MGVTIALVKFLINEVLLISNCCTKKLGDNTFLQTGSLLAGLVPKLSCQTVWQADSF